jgi:hypothetical protein
MYPIASSQENALQRFVKRDHIIPVNTARPAPAAMKFDRNASNEIVNGGFKYSDQRIDRRRAKHERMKRDGDGPMRSSSLP